MRDVSRRIAVFGTAITGILGIVFSINSIMSDDTTGAGLLLIASAIAFVGILVVVDKNQ